MKADMDDILYRVHTRLPEHVQKLRVIFIGHVVSLRMIGNEVWWSFLEDE